LVKLFRKFAAHLINIKMKKSNKDLKDLGSFADALSDANAEGR
jgi:hypothetical protein